MSSIHSSTKSVRQLLSNVKYAIDFYQREYEWERKHIEELFADLENNFLMAYSPDDERRLVQKYPHYFLGTIITVNENNQTYIIDGQQRLTTLTLILIHLHHLGKEYEGIADLRPLIFSEAYGEKSFNVNVPERNHCMRALFEEGSFDATNERDLSVQNLVDRYSDIVELFPETLTENGALPYFVDWLIDNIDLVEIQAQNDEAAFTIFETMNDRGKNLGPTDMLKGYLLANINDYDEQVVHDKKTQANAIWKEGIIDLVAVDKEADVDFFKAWLRARYAETQRERKRGATNQDFENINKFHRWVRDERQRIGLKTSDDFYNFITRNFNKFAGHYVMMQDAASALTPGLESVYYNAYNNFTLQYMMALAPVHVSDPQDIVEKKIQLVADFIDIFIARRIVNFRTLSYSSLVYTMFNITKDIRDLDVIPLSLYLKDYLENMDEAFEGVMEFYLHQQNRTRIRYLLARITDYIERQSSMGSNFLKYIGRDEPTSKPYEIEHIWANHYERHTDEFNHPADFEEYRNYFGGLILLPKSFNQSYSDAPYHEKLEYYYAQNLLARSLNPKCYEKNPGFLKFVEHSGYPFRPHEQFKTADLDERQALYRSLCEDIWHPSRLDVE